VGGEEDLLIVLPGVGLWVDVDEAELPGVCAAIQIGHRHHVRMDEPRASRLGREAGSADVPRGNHETFLFRRSVDIGRNDQSVPMDELGRIGVIEQVDCDRDTFLQADQRTGDLAL